MMHYPALSSVQQQTCCTPPLSVYCSSTLVGLPCCQHSAAAHLMHSPAVSTLQQHICWTPPLSAQCSSTPVTQVHSDYVYCCIQTRLKQNILFLSPQQHNGYSRKLNVCCVEHLYHIRSQMN